MARMVGTQRKLVDALAALLELDHDATEAYRAALGRLDDEHDKAQLASFLADHERHVSELRPVLERQGGRLPESADMKRWLTKGKVVILGLGGERAILAAMKVNEEDTATAYERMLGRDDLTADARALVVRHLEDERRHRRWIEDRLSAFQLLHAH